MNESNLDGELSVKGRVLSIVNKKYTPIKSIHTWTSAFMIYASIMLEKLSSKGLELIKYMQTVRMAATRGHAEGWIQYNEQYRLCKAHSPSSSWDVVDMELWMLLVSTLKTTHTFDSGFPKQQYQGSNNRQDNRSLEFNCRGIVCKLFNKGFCSFGKKCKFPHKCSKCNGNHPLTSCRT